MHVAWILVGQTPVPEPDVEKWARFMESIDNRRVAETFLCNKTYRVSTVFLGLDHCFGFDFSPQGAPILFETMIFNLSGEDEYQTRCSTWLEAEAQHKEAIEWLERRLANADTK